MNKYYILIGQNFITKALITAIFLSGFIFFVNSTSAAIIAQQLDDTAETNFDYEGGYFIQKLSLNQQEFQGSFNKIELKVLSQDGGSWLHSLWVKEVDPNNPNNYSLISSIDNWADFGVPNQWNTIVYDVGNIATKGDKIYEFGIKGRYGYGLKLKGSSNENSYPYGNASGNLGSTKDLYFKIYSIPTISNFQQVKLDGTTPINEGAILTEPGIVFKAQLNDLENDRVKLQVEFRKISEPFNKNDSSGIIESDFFPPGSTVAIQKVNPSSGKYKWRARVIDSSGDASDWQEFGTPGNVDFEVIDIPFISNLGQYKSDGIVPILEGASTRESTIVFKTNLTDPDNHPVKLQVELRQINEPFTGIEDGGILNSDFVSSGSEAVVISSGLIERKYHWRTRAIDSQGNATNWQEFGTAGNVDFLIGDWSTFTDVVQNDSSYTSPRVSNIYQSLGNGLSGTATSIQLRGFSTVWWSPYVQFGILECNSNPIGFDVELWNFGCSFIAGTFVVGPDGNGFINQSINITFNPNKYYAILFYQDWLIGGSTDFEAYPNGSIGSVGSPNSSDNVGELKQAYFRLEGVKMISPSPALKDPVIIVPGIMGSWEKNGEWVIDPIFHTYDDLIRQLTENGYTQGVDLFTFAYNWEKSVALVGDQLKVKIQEARSICQCQKVDIIAHSMGGLVARSYAQSADYQNDIDQIIFLGTPHEGSSFAYLLWEGGDLTPQIFSKGFDRFLELYLNLKSFFSLSGNKFNYIRNNVLSIRDLLPTYNYLKDANTGILRIYPSNYPGNLFLETLNSSLSENKLLERGISLVNIVGNIEPNFIGSNLIDRTLGGIRVINEPIRLPKWEHGYPENYELSFTDHGLEFTEGDGRIIMDSATHNFSSNVIYKADDKLHSKLPTIAWPQISQALLGTSFPEPDSLIAIEEALIIPVLSPVDVQIVDPLGRRIGKDFETDQELNEVPLAFYSGFNTDMEFVAIPNPVGGNYTIKTQGTDRGSYEVQAVFISDITSTVSSFTANTQNNLVEELNFQFNSSAPESTVIIPQDITAPEITHTSIPDEIALNSSSLVFNFSAQDDITGVFSISATLDEQPLSNGDIINFVVPGIHTIEIKAEDFVGNISTKTINFNIVYKFGGFLTPLKINGVYNLGRTLPIKFQLTDTNNNSVSTAKAQLFIAKIQNNIIGADKIPVSSGNANIANLFRYDNTNNQYVYNLSTNIMSVGNWQLKVVLDDGKSYTVLISLK